REEARAEAARKTAQAEAARTEAARAETARRKAQTELASARELNTTRSATPSANTAKTNPAVVPLPKIELLAKSESISPAPPRPVAPATSRPQLQPAPAGAGTVAGRYALQENANTLRDYYRSQNIRVAIEQISVNGRPIYQVRIWR
ncbi:MAG: hypothetical protein WAV81_17105, partial [Candidatus Competibacter sp.]